jgi:hypothetical protein
MCLHAARAHCNHLPGLIGAAGALAGSSGLYDAEDKEADQIWDAVDEYMDERRRVGVFLSALFGGAPLRAQPCGRCTFF